MSTSGELLTYIAEQVKHYEELYKISRGKAFLLWYAVEALDLNQESAFEAVSYDGGNDQGIDLFYVDDEFQRIVIAQGKFNAKGEYNPKTGELLELIHSTDWLANPEMLQREGRMDLAAAATEYNDAIANDYGVDYFFVYMGPPKKELVNTAANTTNASIGSTPSRRVHVVHLGILQQDHNEYLDRANRIGSESLFLEGEQYFEQKGAYGKALVATVSGKELRRLYEKHGDLLFDRNVRLFLGARKGSVNAAIRETLESPLDRPNFWAYNNGLTFICDRFEVTPEGPSVVLHNFSIVNGCQTTVSVANALDGVAQEVTLLARFIAASQEPVVDNIITYTNSQTPIRPWDITSQERVQKRLQKEFEKTPHPFYYALRRGENRNLSSEKKKHFTRNGKIQVIPYDLLGQYLAAFKGMPVIAYKNKSFIFTTHRETVFPSDLRVEEAMMIWLAGEAAAETVREAISEANERGERNEVLILKRGGKMFVLAAMAIVLQERNGTNYLANLKRSVAGSNKTKERLLAYAKLASLWYVEAIKELIRSGEDLSQIVRSPESYPRIQSKVLYFWRVQSMAKSWVDEVLPRL